MINKNWYFWLFFLLLAKQCYWGKTIDIHPNPYGNFLLYNQNTNAVRKERPDDTRTEIFENSGKDDEKPPPAGLEVENFVQQLISRLLGNYNKEAVLVKPIVIHMDVLLLQVKNTIEREGILETVIALMIDWKDIRLKWKPLDYNNLTFLSLSTDQVWLPDIAMTNSADHPYSISRDNRFTVRVTYDGTFKFVPTGTARSWCELKLITFPFDIQHCSLEFESWSLDSSTMTFDGDSDILVDDSFASTQFQLCDHTAMTYQHTYEFTGETFTRVKFDFRVKRKSTFYVINLIFPIMMLSFIQTLTFLIPCSNTTADRIAFGTTNLLTLVVYQTIITEQLPKTSDAVTALSKYVITLIVIAAVGITESVFVERLHNRTLTRPPFWLMFVLKKVPILLHETRAERRHRMSIMGYSGVPGNRTRRSVSGVGERGRMSPYAANRHQMATSMSSSFLPLECSGVKVVNENKEGEHIHVEKNEINTGNYCRTCSQRDYLLFKKQASALSAASQSAVEIPSKGSDSGKTPRKTIEIGKEYYFQWLSTDPTCLWAELTSKLDCVTFVVCIISALSAPLFMFLPLIGIYWGEDDTKCESPNVRP